MSNKRIYSKPGPNGKTLHYNSKGKCVGSSAKSFNGNVNHFDAKGKYACKSWTAPSGAVKHFDAKGKYTGSSINSAFGGQIHFDSKGRVSSRSAEGFGDRYATTFTGVGEDKHKSNVHITPNYRLVSAKDSSQKPENKREKILGIVGLIVIIALVIGYWWILGPFFIFIIFLLLLAV